MNEESLNLLSEYIKNRGYKFSTITEIYNDIISLGANRYINCGTHTICFANDAKGTVIKCCRKSPETIIRTKESFEYNISTLVKFGFPILKPLEVIETKNYIIYTQNFCVQWDETNISPIILNKILSMVHLMFKTQIKIADIYWKNFGIYENELYIFDFHNIEDFKCSSCNFLITNLYCLFIRVGFNYLKWNVPDLTLTTSSKILADNYGKDKFPNDFYRLLKNLSVINLVESEKHVKGAIEYLNKYINYKFQLGETEISKRLLEITSYFNITTCKISYLTNDILTFIKYRPDIRFTLSHDVSASCSEENFSNYLIYNIFKCKKEDDKKQYNLYITNLSSRTGLTLILTKNYVKNVNDKILRIDAINDEKIYLIRK